MVALSKFQIASLAASSSGLARASSWLLISLAFCFYSVVRVLDLPVVEFFADRSTKPALAPACLGFLEGDDVDATFLDLRTGEMLFLVSCLLPSTTLRF